jgi:sec-independent protein translocase protein TatB
VLFDIGPGEFLVIAIVGLLIVGPDRLPKMLAEGVKWLRLLRDQALKARSEIVAAADFDPSVTDELRRSVSDIAELHPKRLMGSLLSDVVDGPATSPAPAPVTPAVPPVPPPVNSFGANATSTSLGPSPSDAQVTPPSIAPSTPPAAFDADAT